MSKKKILNKDVLNLAILTTIAVFTWIVLDIYRIFNKPPKLDVTKEELKPIVPNFDQETLESLKTRKIINSEQIKSVPELTEFKLIPKESSPSTNQASPSAEETTLKR